MAETLQTERVTHVLYVDENDVCTAQMAAALANELAKEQGLDVVFSSAGVFAAEHTITDELAVRAFKEVYNVDLPVKHSRPLTPEVFNENQRVKTTLYRLNSFVNDKAHRWPNNGNFNLVCPVGKDYEAYVACAKRLYPDVANQISALVQEGHVLPKGSR